MFLGVDGGGTKTSMCLVADDGRVAATIQAPSCYYLGKREGVALVARVLHDGVAEVCERAGITPAELAHGFLGLPAYGEVSADLPALAAAARAARGVSSRSSPPQAPERRKATSAGASSICSVP